MISGLYCIYIIAGSHHALKRLMLQCACRYYHLLFTAVSIAVELY